MSNSEPECKAKVFVSCGQKTRSERRVSEQVRSWLEKSGYEAYVATTKQNLDDVKRIIHELISSEYFLFIDFRRNRKGKDELPLSLFSHQELAIATAADMEAVVLRQSGSPRVGLIKYLALTNAELFVRHKDVVAIVKKRIKRANWSPAWKNALSVTEAKSDDTDVLRQGTVNGKPCKYLARFFHICVRNRHKHRVARRCVAYLKCVTDADDRRINTEWPIEHKWDGFMFPEASIRPQEERQLDAFYMIREITAELPARLPQDSFCAPSITAGTNSAEIVMRPVVPCSERTASRSDACTPNVQGKAYPNTLTDCVAYQQPISRGDYKFTYEILAEDFPATQATFDVHIDDDASKTTMKPLKQSYHYL